ncbi:MAG: hypothetical protein KJZ73_12980 [Pseudorhodoplanes sp.]|nr:hypothetical protein [Pseudorhodoplanes sp.]
MMPQVEWEWKFSPQTVLSALNLAVILVGVIGLFYKMQSDLTVAKENVLRLEAVVTSLNVKQSELSERSAKTETKVDIILPTVQRIEQSLRTTIR